MDLIKSVLLFALLLVSIPVNASNTDDWDTVSDIGAYGLVGVALAAPAVKEDWEGFKQAGFSIATATGVGLLGKALVDEVDTTLLNKWLARRMMKWSPPTTNRRHNAP